MLKTKQFLACLKEMIGGCGFYSGDPIKRFESITDSAGRRLNGVPLVASLRAAQKVAFDIVAVKKTCPRGMRSGPSRDAFIDLSRDETPFNASARTHGVLGRNLTNHRGRCGSAQPLPRRALRPVISILHQRHLSQERCQAPRRTSPQASVTDKGHPNSHLSCEGRAETQGHC